MYLQSIRQSLTPRLAHILAAQPADSRQAIIDMFMSHTTLIADHFRENMTGHAVSIEFLVRFHILFYPADHEILATGNDGVEKTAKPGEFRKHFLARYVTDFSPVESVESELSELLARLNSIHPLRREDILRFFFDFWKIHPFPDSNGTISGVLCDVLCEQNWFTPFHTLNIRFKDKGFGFSLVSLFEQDSSDDSLRRILAAVDRFNEANPIPEIGRVS